MKLIDADKLIEDINKRVFDSSLSTTLAVDLAVRWIREAPTVADDNTVGYLGLDMSIEKMRCSVCNSVLEGCRRIKEKEAGEEEEMRSKETMLGDRISKYLAERKMTQRQFAQKIGMTEVSVSRYVNNDRLPNANVVVRMAKALGISTDELLGMDDA